jgi:hypothetical protein
MALIQFFYYGHHCLGLATVSPTPPVREESIETFPSPICGTQRAYEQYQEKHIF